MTALPANHSHANHSRANHSPTNPPTSTTNKGTSNTTPQGNTSRWTGRINLNANLALSTQDTQSFFVEARATNKLEQGNQLDYSLLYILSRQTTGDPKEYNTTEDRWTITGRYEAPSSNRKYGFVEQRLENNKLVDLAFRSITTAGFGYYAVRTENTLKTGKVELPGDAEWRLNFGLSYLSENYLNDLGSRQQRGLQFGSSFRKIFKRGISVNHYLDFIPSLNNLAEYFWVSNLAVAFPLNTRTSLALNWISDYDSSPAPGARKDNNKFALTVGFKF